MIKYNYKLTEEISRWAFEIHVNQNEFWEIIFTNPTAGPWKRLVAKDKDGTSGEVYRFHKEEKRPDIIIVNDYLKSILIIEAKDSLKNLISEKQVKKSCKVVGDMARILSGISSNKYWGERSQYTIYNTLLWGEEDKSNKGHILKAFKLYEEFLLQYEDVVSLNAMIGLESRRISNKLSLFPHGLTNNKVERDIIDSLGIKN